MQSNLLAVGPKTASLTGTSLFKPTTRSHTRISLKTIFISDSTMPEYQVQTNTCVTSLEVSCSPDQRVQ